LAQWGQVGLHQSIDNHETADVMAAAASGGQGEQIGMKRGGIDLLVMPPPLNDKLSPRPPRSVDQVTGRA
jgi:hypothetical protein